MKTSMLVRVAAVTPTALILCSLAFLSLVSDARAQSLYAYRAGSGSITFTSQRPKGKSYWKVSNKSPRYSKFVHRGLGYGVSKIPKPSAYDDLILEVAKEHRLEAALIKAVMHVESAFDPDARSPVGARGLMQLMPGTAERFGVRDMHNPKESLHGGVKYLRWLFETFNGNLRHVLAGYNAGEGAVKKYKGIPPYKETQDYVRRVMSLAGRYRCDFSGSKKECI